MEPIEMGEAMDCLVDEIAELRNINEKLVEALEAEEKLQKHTVECTSDKYPCMECEDLNLNSFQLRRSALAKARKV